VHEGIFGRIRVGAVFFVVLIFRACPNIFRDTRRRSLSSLEFPKFAHEVGDILNEPPCVVEASARESFLHDSDDGDTER